MYYPIEGGTKEVIQGYECQLPPIGYGKNRLTGQLEYVGVIKRSVKTEKQYWQRIELPEEWDKKRKIEIKQQPFDPEYYDTDLEKIREQHWRYRLCGLWFYNNGRPTYITGAYYMYLNWCPIDIGYPHYRDTDRWFYYVWEFCCEDPRCAGLVDIERRRMGKCLGYDTPVRMYDGSVKMVQDIKEGDLVMGDDGTARTAFGITTGEETMYKVIPNKGKTFTCNESHILSLKYNKRDRHKIYGWSPGDTVNITVRDFLRLKFWERDHLVLYRVGWGHEYPENKHLLPPYILGVFLGDGTAINGDISNPDPEIIEAYEQYASKNNLQLKTKDNLYHRITRSERCGRFNPYRQELNRLNLFGNKHIPKEYLIDSEKNRFELLAGLIDTDGYLNRNKSGGASSYEITQKSEILAIQITELTRSLGLNAKRTKKTATMVRKDGTVYRCLVYRIYISGEIEKIPCKVKRKKALVITRRVDPMRTGIKIECLGVGKYYGFAVDKNSLFILSDGTVIHNTFKSGSILLDRTSLHKNHHGGIQSKTLEDAKQVFRKTSVTFFKKMPDFFRPVYDKTKGLTPSTELRFFQTVKKGRNADALLDEDELESWIDFGSSESFYYDGSKLNSYVCDEFGKTMENNVWDRWNVVRFCLDQDGVWVGKALFTTTIEEMENGGENGKKIWDSSDPNERNENGRTKSGMYRFFLPAFETTFFDQYGMPEVERAKDYYLKERAGLQNDPRALSSIIRKNPFDIHEAFRIDGDRCLYDAMKLNLQIDSLSYKQNLTTRGNFVWENGEAFTNVRFEKSRNGRWEVCYLFERHEDANKVVARNGRYYPNNNFAFTIGCDPFKYDAVKDARRSDCAALVYKKNNPLDQHSPYNNAFVCYYRYRAVTTALQYEDLLKMAWYYGCQILFERNIDNWRDFYKTKNCEGFLMKLPGEDDYGIYSDGQKQTHQLLADYTEAYINEHVEKVYFKKLLEEWLLFDIGATTKWDSAMAAGFALIAARDKVYNRTIESTRDVTNYFRIYKAPA